MKDLVIGCSDGYDWDTLKYWINSLNSCGFEGDKVLILFNASKDTCVKVSAAGIHIIGTGQDDEGNLVHKSTLPVHVERFLYIFDFLSKNDYRYVVTTDVKDVIFQKNPIEFIEKNLDKNEMIFSSESLLYMDEPWGNQNLFETFGQYFYDHYKNNEIFNVGVLAGTSKAIKGMCSMIFNMGINRQIPIVDQAVFNYIISHEPYLSNCLYLSSEEGWACQLGTTGDPSKDFDKVLLDPKPRLEGDIVVTSIDSIPFYIVHQYDRVPDMKKIIESKFGGE